MPAVRGAMVAGKDSASKLWVTEFGYATCPAVPTCVTEERQAAWTNGALKLASTWSYLEAFTLFTLTDDAIYPGNPDFSLHFGLATTSGTPKPAYKVVSDWFHK